MLRNSLLQRACFLHVQMMKVRQISTALEQENPMGISLQKQALKIYMWGGGGAGVSIARSFLDTHFIKGTKVDQNTHWNREIKAGIADQIWRKKN